MLRFGEIELSGVEWEILSAAQAVGRVHSLDFLIVQRNALTLDEAEEIISACRRYGVRLVFEIDDDLFESVEERIDRDRVAAIQLLARMAFVITTPTYALRAKLLKYNRNVVVIENKLSADLWIQPVPIEVPSIKLSSGLKILYMGTFTHGADLDLVVDAFRRLVSEGVPIKLYTVGVDTRQESDMFCRVNIPSGWTEYPRFVWWLRTLAKQFDFAIAPLVDSPFNACKSGLKYLDYAGLGLPGIFSNVPAYSQVVTHEVTGLLAANHVSSWMRHLRSLILNEELRIRVRTEARKDLIQNHLISTGMSKFARAIGVEPFPPSRSLDDNVRKKFIADAHLIRSSPFFDENWYYDQYFYIHQSRFVDAKQQICADAALHFLAEGAARLWDPSPVFSTQGYLDRYDDVREAGINSLVHFEKFGRGEGRHPVPRKGLSTDHLRRPLYREGGPITDILPFRGGWVESTSPRSTICVHLHLYHEDLLDQMIAVLHNLERPFTLLVSVKSDQVAGRIAAAFERRLAGARIVVSAVPNRGRDVAPWAAFFKEEILKHDIFCHLHTKNTISN